MQCGKLTLTFIVLDEVVKEIKPKEAAKRKSTKKDAPATKKSKGSPSQPEQYIPKAPTFGALFDQRKTTSNAAAAAVAAGTTTVAEPVRHNFAPGEKKPANENVVIWEGYIGNEWYLRYQKWLRTDQCYVCIRKNHTQGANLPVEMFWGLHQAINALGEQCKFPKPE